VPPGELVLVPADKGAEGIHGPLSLPPESDFDELSELDGGPLEKSGGVMMFLGGRCADTGVGNRQITSAASKPASADARENRVEAAALSVNHPNRREVLDCGG